MAYGTGEGQTATVANRIVEVLVDRGHDASAVDVAVDPVPDLTNWDDVEAFAKDFAAFVEGRLGIVPSAATDVSTAE